MYAISQTTKFSEWLHSLKDTKGKIAIARRIARAQSGNLGDVEAVCDQVFEMRIDFGPGYRVYYIIQDGKLIILLCAGDKSTQKRDIVKAKEIVKEFIK
jgi:putative addiction module killer protein